MFSSRQYAQLLALESLSYWSCAKKPSKQAALKAAFMRTEPMQSVPTHAAREPKSHYMRYRLRGFC